MFKCFIPQVAVTITNEKSVSCVLSSVARNLLKADITWCQCYKAFYVRNLLMFVIS